MVKAKTLRNMAYAENTVKTRISQWNKYIKFCSIYSLVPLPASEEQVCNYVAYLTQSLKFSSIQNYLSGLNYFQRLHGHVPINLSSFMLSQTLRGAKRLLGTAVNQTPLLQPKDLKNIFFQLDMTSSLDLCFWCALLTCFRALLRVSHVTESYMNLCVKDIRFHDWGLMLKIDKSKTIQFAERILQIPVCSVTGSIFDLCYYLKCLFTSGKLKPDDMAFSYIKKSKSVPLTYAVYSRKLKNLCLLLGLPNATSHSLRRSGASYLFSLRQNLISVKQRGDWKSLCVLLYLSESLEDIISREKDVAFSLLYI